MMLARRKTAGAQDRLAQAGRQGFLAALDIGTHKIACVLAVPGREGADDDPGLRIIGVGHHLSRGVRGGTIIDMDLAEAGIRAAVEAAERMAGATVEDVIVNVSCGKPTSETLKVEAQLGGRAVGERDLRQLIALGRMEAERDGRAILHASPLAYAVDGALRIRDPRGMMGGRVGVQLHAVSVQDGPLRNLELCVARCHLSVAGRVLSAYASGLGALVADEKELGATLIDMGAGTTAISVFHEGGLVFADVVPLGGASITADIARGLSTPLEHAERLKTLYGSALVSPADDRDQIKVPQVGEDDPDAVSHVPRSMLTRIIRPRMEEIVELVRDRLAASGFEAVSGRRVVLTGGASQLTGARENVQRILNKQTRLGRPFALAGHGAVAGPAFATCAGLLTYARAVPIEAGEGAGAREGERQRTPWLKFSQWLKDNL